MPDGSAAPDKLGEEMVLAIYREHGAALWRFAARASSGPDAADDVVQETVMKVWQAAPRIRGSLRAYLFRTARNVMVDNHRRASARPATAASEDPVRAPDRTHSIERVLDRIVLEEALARLGRPHREVVLALYYRRETVAAAAVRLGVPEGTIKSRAFHAVRALRAALEEMGVDP